MKKFYNEWKITIWIVIFGTLFMLLMSTETIVYMIRD